MPEDKKTRRGTAGVRANGSIWSTKAVEAFRSQLKVPEGMLQYIRYANDI